MARIYSPAWIDGREALRGPFIVQPATLLLSLALLALFLGLPLDARRRVRLELLVSLRRNSDGYFPGGDEMWD